jgi:hypothetical protein
MYSLFVAYEEQLRIAKTETTPAHLLCRRAVVSSVYAQTIIKR